MLFTKEIIVSGKVQGVFFRRYTCEAAATIGVSGYVKNQPDHSVYILATGTSEQLEQFVSWCRQGSPGSKVEKAEVKEMELQLFDQFTIVR